MRTNILSLVLALMIASCAQSTTTPFIPTAAQIEPTVIGSVSASTQEVPVTFTLTSTAFTQGQPIPTDYSCKGRDISPALSWTEPPANTQSFALIMDDPDAPSGTWVHWVIYNIPASSRGLNEAMPKDAKLSDGSMQGTNSARNTGYNGPCPPSGTHRYFFKLYALDTMLSLTNADKDKLLKAMDGHILAQAELMGTFSK